MSYFIYMHDGVKWVKLPCSNYLEAEESYKTLFDTGCQCFLVCSDNSISELIDWALNKSSKLKCVH